MNFVMNFLNQSHSYWESCRFLLKGRTVKFKKIFDPTVFNGKHADNTYWFVAPLQNSNEIFIAKSSSDGGNLNRFGVRRNVYGFHQKRKINDFK